MNIAANSATSSVEYSLLGLLGDRPMHGYELHQELRHKTGLGLIWSVKQAQLYAILAKLESEGYIAGEVVVLGNRPARRVFHLTDEGKKAYGGWVCSPVARRDFRVDFLAKLYFAQRDGRTAAKKLLVAQKQLCKSWLNEMRERGDSCGERTVDRLVYRYRVGQLEATLSWLDECSEYLGSHSVVADRS
jgi:PadR family transcriptional regulator AphA